MRTLSTIYEFYKEMRSTTKRNEKIAMLEKWKNNKDVVNILKLLYDPMITFGVTSDAIKLAKSYTLMSTDTKLIDVLNTLANRVRTGGDALVMCASFMESSLRYLNEWVSIGFVEFIHAIFDKDLKLGIDTKTINKVIPGLIDTFDVALAHDINKSPTYMRRVDTEKYLITRKLDGVRCLTIVKEGDIKFYSRLGHEYTSLSVLRSALTSILPDKWSGVLDGELCVIDDNDNENFKLAVSEVKRKEAQMERPHYKVFDCLTLDEFYGKTESPRYSLRLVNAKILLSSTETPFLSVLGAVNYSPDNFITAQQVVSQRGYEGLILRADVPYRSGRSSDLLKVKKFTDAEYVIEDFTKTTKLMKGLSGVMEPVECLGSVVIRHKGSPVEVGSGFSDAMRIDIWNNQERYIGRTITVKYFEESCDSKGNASLRFPIFKGFRDTIE